MSTSLPLLLVCVAALLSPTASTVYYVVADGGELCPLNVSSLYHTTSLSHCRKFKISNINYIGFAFHYNRSTAVDRSVLAQLVGNVCSYTY